MVFLAEAANLSEQLRSHRLELRQRQTHVVQNMKVQQPDIDMPSPRKVWSFTATARRTALREPTKSLPRHSLFLLFPLFAFRLGLSITQLSHKQHHLR